MAQPTRKKKKKIIGYFPQGTGQGLEYCDECPFLEFRNGVPYCGNNGSVLSADSNGFVIIPNWCGNKK